MWEQWRRGLGSLAIGRCAQDRKYLHKRREICSGIMGGEQKTWELKVSHGRNQLKKETQGRLGIT